MWKNTFHFYIVDSMWLKELEPLDPVSSDEAVQWGLNKVSIWF